MADMGFPARPLPRRGDRVLVAVQSGTADPPAARWCRVIEIRDTRDHLFPVIVRTPSGRQGAYQQHEVITSRTPWWRRWFG